MCISAAAIMAISAGVTVVGTIAQGQAQKAAADAQAREYEDQAAAAQVAATEEAKRIRKAGERTAGAARAALAASGVVVDEGTGVNINEDIYRNSEQDAYNTLLTGKNQSGSLQRSAVQSRTAGSNAVTSSLLSAAGTGMQGYAGWKNAPKLMDSTRIPMQPGGGY